MNSTQIPPLIPNSSLFIPAERLVALLVFCIPTYLVRFSIGPIPTTLFEVVLWLIFIYFAYAKLITFKFWKTDPLRWPILLIVIGSFIGVVVAPDLRAAAGQWKALILDPFIFYWIVRQTLISERQVGLLLNAGLASAVLIASHALIQGLIGNVAADGRVLGIYASDSGASPNYLALYLAPWATLGLLLAYREQPRRLFFLIATGLIVWALAMTQSRAGLGALTVGSLVGFAWLISRVRPKWRTTAIAVSGFILVTGLALIGPSFLPDLSASQDSGRISSSNNIRYEIWKTTAEILSLQTTHYSLPTWLVGVGLANYQNYFTNLTAGRVNYPEFIAPLALHPHNFFLATWVNLGLVGLIGWIWLLILLISRWRNLSTYQIIFAAAFITWLIHGLVDTTYYKNDLAPLTFWLIAGLVIDISRKLANKSN